jgi:CDP-diacylglycerol--serine O-phosphatidyltransferase
VNAKRAIPNTLTILNLVFGIFATLSILHGELVHAGYFIIAAMISDGLDGRVARYLNVSGDFGKELDSLCDMVSFGAVPAVLAYAFCLKEFGFTGWVIAAVFASCGAWRLARFNINTNTVKGHYVGLPIPAAGCSIAAYVIAGFELDARLFAAMVVLLSFLMISTIKHPDFKGQSETPKKIPAVITIAICVLIVIFNYKAIFFVPFFGLVMFGILNTVYSMFKRIFPAK